MAGAAALPRGNLNPAPAPAAPTPSLGGGWGTTSPVVGPYQTYNPNGANYTSLAYHPNALTAPPSGGASSTQSPGLGQASGIPTASAFDATTTVSPQSGGGSAGQPNLQAVWQALLGGTQGSIQPGAGLALNGVPVVPPPEGATLGPQDNSAMALGMGQSVLDAQGNQVGVPPAAGIGNLTGAGQGEPDYPVGPAGVSGATPAGTPTSVGFGGGSGAGGGGGSSGGTSVGDNTNYWDYMSPGVAGMSPYPLSGGGYSNAYPGNYTLGGGGYAGGGGGLGGGGGSDPLAAMAQAYPNLVAAQLGPTVAGINAGGQVGAAHEQAAPGLLAAQLAPGIQAGINTTQQGIANTQAGAQTGVAGIQAGASNYAADKQLAAALGVSENDLKGIMANAAAQQNIAGINVAPQNTMANAKAAALEKLFGNPGGILGALGLGGAGGAGGVGGAGGAGGTGGAPSGQPPIPSMQPFNAGLLQSLEGQQLANQDVQTGTAANNGLNQLGQSGMQGLGANTNTSGLPQASGLNPEVQNQLAQQRSIVNNQNMLDIALASSQANNQANQAYGQMGLDQYNQNQNRALQQLLGLGQLGIGALGQLS